jgi:hypothetical protein
MVRLSPCRLRRGRDETGAVAVLVGVLTIVMFTLTALVVDLGMARVVRREAQVASDSSTLAAANALYLSGTSTPDVSGAVAAAKTYAADNYGVTDADWAGCDDPGHLTTTAVDTTCISFQLPSAPTDPPPQIRVVVPIRNVKLPFGAVAGASSVNVDAYAQAALKPGFKADCGLCVIGGGTHELQNGDVHVSGGSVALNGSVDVHNNGQVTSDGNIYVQDTATGPADGYSPTPYTGTPEMPDPLSTYQLPSDFSSMGVHTNPCTDEPGIYGSYNFSNTTCTLQPGLYVITGEWSFTGNAGMVGNGVTLYFTCGTTSAPVACSAPGEDGGWLNAAGNGIINVTAPTSGPTQGLAIAYDRLDTSPLVLDGNGASSYVGTVYAYSAEMTYDGNGCTSTNTSLIVVGGLTFNGTNACLQTNYTESANVYVPPSDPHLTQ